MRRQLLGEYDWRGLGLIALPWAATLLLLGGAGLATWLVAP